MDQVFRALADPTRRSLLDALFEADGQTLGALEATSPLSRFGVMKHLRVLEEAGLVTTRRSGREKHHYLNPVPIRLLYERWVSKYAEPWAATLTGLKRELEEPMPASQVYTVFIRTTPERIWEMLTTAEGTRRYWHESHVHSDWQVGSEVVWLSEDGETTWIRGELLEVDPPRRLVHTFEKRWDEGEPEAPSRVTWEIEQQGEMCKLVMVHDEMGPDTAGQVTQPNGWPLILSGLKTLLETGEELEAA